MDKKGILEMALWNPPSLIILITIIIISAAVFGISSISHKGSDQYIKGVKDINIGVDEIFRYLDSETDFNGDKIKISDLLRLHCDTPMLDKIKKDTNFFNLPFPIVISVTCPNKNQEIIREPLCGESRELVYQKNPKQKIKINYCLRPEINKIIKTPDGKEWKFSEKTDLDSYWDSSSEKDISENDLRLLYHDYDEPSKVESRQSSFEDNVKKQTGIVLPTGEEWIKIGKNWCLSAIGTKTLSCESNLITEEQLIECQGSYETCKKYFGREDLLN